MAQDEPTIETISTTDEEALDDSMHDNLEPIAKKYKGGRMKADVWNFFTETKNPQKLQSAPCKNCKAIVKYYSKLERVRQHLNTCSAFRKLMKRTEPIDRPDWYRGINANESIIFSEKVVEGQDTRVRTPSHGSTHSQQSSQSLLKTYLIPAISDAEAKKVQKHVARFFYKTGTSFVRVEDKDLQKAFSICRPGVLLPSRKQLAGPLLDDCYQDVKRYVEDHLSAVNAVCIVSDGWTNVCSEPVINYIEASPSKTLFIESVSTGDQAHTAQFIADISRIIASFQCDVVGAVTDNTSANKSAWKILEEKYPDKFFHGCASHCPHLLVKDIFDDTKQCSKNNPFDYLSKFVDDCKSVAVFFKNHHALNHRLRELQQEKQVQSLALPAATRWGSINHCLNSLLNSEDILFAIVSARDFVSSGPNSQRESREKVKATICDPCFVDNLKKALAIVKPIDELIRMFQDDGVPVSEVYHSFLVLPRKYESEKMTALAPNELSFMKTLIEQRFNFIYGDAHGVGYLLDPRFVGEKMDKKLRHEIEDFIFNFPVANPELADQKSAVYQELTQYMIEAKLQKQNNSFRYQMLVKKKKSVLEYWLTDGADWPLMQRIALKVFSLVVSTASSERNFSTFGFIHSKLRNQLSTQTVRKLVFVKTNFGLLESSRDCESDEVSEAETLNLISVIFNFLK